MSDLWLISINNTAVFQLLLGSACTASRSSQFLTLQSQWVGWMWARGWEGTRWGQLTQVGQSIQDPRTQNSSLSQFISPGWIGILAPASYWAVKCCKKTVWTNRVFLSCKHKPVKTGKKTVPKPENSSFLKKKYFFVFHKHFKNPVYS